MIEVALAALVACIMVLCWLVYRSLETLRLTLLTAVGKEEMELKRLAMVKRSQTAQAVRSTQFPPQLLELMKKRKPITIQKPTQLGRVMGSPDLDPGEKVSNEQPTGTS